MGSVEHRGGQEELLVHFDLRMVYPFETAESEIYDPTFCYFPLTRNDQNNRALVYGFPYSFTSFDLFLS